MSLIQDLFGRSPVRPKLFAAEAELGVTTFFWWELVRWVADLADHAERVGNRLRLLIAV